MITNQHILVNESMASGGANQKFFPPLSALRRGVWGEPHKKMKGKFLGLPRERSERPEARQVFRSKWVRAKVSISPQKTVIAFMTYFR